MIRAKCKPVYHAHPAFANLGNIATGRPVSALRCPAFVQKLIRAAHAKEKQLQKNSCNRPNRLNLLDWTACGSARSNFFTKNSCLVRFPLFRSLNKATHAIRGSRFSPEMLVALQKICLHNG